MTAAVGDVVEGGGKGLYTSGFRNFIPLNEGSVRLTIWIKKLTPLEVSFRVNEAFTFRVSCRGVFPFHSCYA